MLPSHETDNAVHDAVGVLPPCCQTFARGASTRRVYFPMAISAVARASFADHLDQHPLPPASIEFSVEDLFPRAKIQSALGNRHDNFSPLHLTLDMSVAVILACLVMAIGGRLWSHGFEKPLV